MSESENAAIGGDRRRPASESDSEDDMLGRASTLHESLTGWGTIPLQSFLIMVLVSC